MIDIALEAPSAGAPELAKPLIPEPLTPKTKIKPIKKPIPKPVKEKKATPVKKPAIKEALSQPIKQTNSAPIKDDSSIKPVVGTQAASNSRISESGKISPARANAAYLNNPKPNYPGIARSRHWEGLVLLRVHVTADGRCGDVNLYRGSGHDVLDEAAIEAVKRWRFVPGKRGDSPIASWVTVPIEFHLR